MASQDLAGLRFRIRCVHTTHEEDLGAALALGVSQTGSAGVFIR